MRRLRRAEDKIYFLGNVWRPLKMAGFLNAVLKHLLKILSETEFVFSFIYV